MSRFTSFDAQELNKLVAQASNRAAAAFGEMINLPVTVHLSNADLLDWQAVEQAVAKENITWGSAVYLAFKNALQVQTAHGYAMTGEAMHGNAIFLLPTGSDTALVEAIIRQNPDLLSMENAQENILLEIGNVLLNACVGTITNQLDIQVVYDTPQLVGPGVMRRLFEGQEGKSSPALWLRSVLGIGGLEVNAEIVLIMTGDM